MDAPFPLSSAQSAIWLAEQLAPRQALFNMPVAWRVSGAVRATALARALDDLIRRHASLRTRYFLAKGALVQQEISPCQVTTRLVDLSAVVEGESRSRAASAVIFAEAWRPFDLAAGPLFRAVMLRLGATEYVLLLTLHHIACDGWSFRVLVQELATRYRAHCSGKPSPPLAPAPSYREFVAREETSLRDGMWTRQLEFWTKRLAVPPAPLFHRQRSGDRWAFGRAGVHTLRLDRATAGTIGELARREGASPFVGFIALLQILFHRLSGEAVISIGVDVANRDRRDIQSMVGLLANQLVIRVVLESGMCFVDVLTAARRAVADALSHQECPYGRIVSALKRPPDAPPLFQVKVAYQETAPILPQFPDLATEHVRIDRRRARFDLTVFATRRDDELALMLEYDRRVFGTNDVAALAEEFVRLCKQVASCPTAPIETLAVCRPSHHDTLSVDHASF